MRTICNPINISYNYPSGYEYGCRESADPAVIVYKGEYYLFASHGEGYWVSKDLANWEFIFVDIKKYPEFHRFAPAPCVVGDRVWLTHSERGSILYSDDPRDPDSWTDIGKPFDWFDPCLYYEDGYIYLYEGLTTDGEYLTVSKFDANMNLLEGPNKICTSDRKNRGCERHGHNHELDRITFFEGPWINKIDGKYYLQCAIPGTEYDVYADVCFVADHPMGPFTYCDNSPVSFKSTGYVRGCGHGCLFEDLNGNLWKVQTNNISVHHMFERRISIYPAKVIDDRLYVNTLRSDYPMLVPTENQAPFADNGVNWELLSYGKSAYASSVLDENHAPELVCDEHMATWWCAKTADKGEWLTLDLEKAYQVAAVQVNFADEGVLKTIGGRTLCTGYQYKLEASLDGEQWVTLLDRSENEEDIPHDYLQLDEEITARYFRITNLGNVAAGSLFAISGLRVFGPACGEKVKKAPTFTAVRGKDTRDMFCSIEQVEGAQGYIVRLGVKPEEQYIAYTYYADKMPENVRIGCLNVGVEYYVSVDAFSEAGVVKGETVVRI